MMDKISLAGDLGSGKSTVSEILIARLGAEKYSTGSIVRALAEKYGMSVKDFNVYMETHPEIDHEVDDGLVKLSSDERFLIIDSRMAWHFTKGTFKLYLSTDIEVSAARIMSANRVGEHAASLEETVKETRERRASEKKRYELQYGVDIKDLSNYSVVVDTTYASPAEVADCIIAAFSRWQKDKSYKALFISPERLHYPDDDADGVELAKRCASLELGEEIPEVCVSERDGEFYLVSGHESALAYAMNMNTYIPARLTPYVETDKKYVRMANSL